jgi:undecaprenyl-diphosphatase
MNALHAIILGIVEGLTEFLPVSSTAHLLLFTSWFHIPETDFVKSFTIIIQLGAILAVAVLYIKRLLTDIETMKRVIAAFIPTAIVGFVLYHFIKGFLFAHPIVPIIALIVFGIVLIIFERMHKAGASAAMSRAAIGESTGASPDTSAELRRMPYRSAFLIGLAQSIAVIPGVSRSGATIVAGLLMGITRSAIVEFSFLLAVPTMIAASGYDLLKTGASFSGNDFGILAIGFIAAFVSAWIAVKFFLKFISRNSFEAFGWYRIAFAIIFALLIF